jgi:S-DNA-T family DNA segregation ATPase FtsK/SpoIIIE
MGTAASKRKTRQAPALQQIIDRLRPFQRELMGSILLLFSIITLLSLLSLNDGSLSRWWANIFTQLFGWGAIPAAMLVGVLGALLLVGRFKDEYRELPLDIIIGIELLFVSLLAVVHLLAVEPGEYAVRLARNGGGGGFVGWGVSNFFAELVGPGIGLALLILIVVIALIIIFRVTTNDAAAWAEVVDKWAREKLAEEERLAYYEQQDSPAPVPEPPAASVQHLLPVSTESKPAAKPPQPVKASTVVMPSSRHQLPPVDLLAAPTTDPTHDVNARYQAQIIEETLQGFGIPAEVVEINTGPTVTQFGLQLGTVQRKLPDGNLVEQRIRVSKVAALSNDLALALSAAPIRIETPVPGRPLVGIEVPNSQKTMVSLRGVMDDKSFNKSKKPLLIALGKDVSGRAIAASLIDMPHLLVAGATGSGKSVCVNALISSLLMTYSPEQLRFLMIDPKMVELTGFNGIPHLVAPVVTDFEQVVGALAWVTREMERRYKLFAKAGARSLSGYNKKVPGKNDRLPYLVVIIDELADLMMLAPDEVERYVARIAQMARATGIHMIIATQRPSVDVVTGLIKANFPTRIAFAVTSQIDSRVILDTPGAEKLLGKGDMLYMASDSPKLARLQGCFVSDQELQNLVHFWTRATPAPVTVEAEIDTEEQEKLPWDDLLAEANKDDMLDQAIKLVTESGRASTSMLQRRLGIGYPRASRMMDQLEEEGVIGPANGSKPREVFWHQGADPATDNHTEFKKELSSDS